MEGEFDYYNLELPNWNHDSLVVAGVITESLAPIRRMIVSRKEFNAFIKERYGVITPTVREIIRKKVIFLKDGRVDMPAIKSLAK